MILSNDVWLTIWRIHWWFTNKVFEIKNSLKISKWLLKTCVVRKCKHNNCWISLHEFYNQTGAQYSAVECTKARVAIRRVVDPAHQPEPASRLRRATRDVSFFRSDSRCRRYVSDLSKVTPRYLGSEQKRRISLLCLTLSSRLASLLLRWKAVDTVFVVLNFSFQVWRYSPTATMSLLSNPSTQWRSSHLDILDLSRSGRFRRGDKNWPKTVAFIIENILHFQKYSEYKGFRDFFILCFLNSNCFSSWFCWTHPLKTRKYCTLARFFTINSRCLTSSNNLNVTCGYHCLNCDQVSIAYVTKELYDIPTWLGALWSCSVFASRVHDMD